MKCVWEFFCICRLTPVSVWPTVFSHLRLVWCLLSVQLWFEREIVQIIFSGKFEFWLRVTSACCLSWSIKLAIFPRKTYYLLEWQGRVKLVQSCKIEVVSWYIILSERNSLGQMSDKRKPMIVASVWPMLGVSKVSNCFQEKDTISVSGKAISNL